MLKGIEDKPYIEWLHGIVALGVGSILHRLGSAFGTAAVDVHLCLDDDPARRTILLPDVVFFLNETLLGIAPADRTLPNVPPEVIVEIRSPNDRPGFRESKIERYLAWGAPLVLDISIEPRSIITRTRDASRTYRPGDRFEHPAAPWLFFEVDEVFAKLDLFGF